MKYGYTVFLKDFMSSKMMKIATTAQTSYGKITKLQAAHQKRVFAGGKSIDSLNSKLQKLQKQRGAATSVRDIKQLNIAIRKTRNSLQKLEKMPPASFLSRINTARKNLGGMATAAVAGIGIMGAYNGLKGLYNLGADAESSRLKFEVLLGSINKANQMIANINKYANATPFNNKDLKQNAELLLSFGTAESKVLPTLKMIGDVSGGNKEKLNSLTLAYAQMSSTGKLMGQDLLQMINAGFNPLQVISEKTGKSMGVLKKEMSEGRISSKMVEQAFASATSKGGRFFGMLEKMSKSSSGLASTLVGGWQTKLANFSEKYFLPIVNKGLKFGLKLMDGFEKLEQPIVKFFKAFAPITNAIGSLIGRFLGMVESGGSAAGVLGVITGILSVVTPIIEVLANGIGTVVGWLEPLTPLLTVITTAVLGLKVAVWLWNIAMYANPIGLIIGAIVVLVGIVVTAWKKVDWFRGGILAIWETLKGFGGAIKELVVDRIKEMLRGVTGIGKALMHFFSGNWKKAWETGKQAAQDLIGVGTAQKAIAKAKDIGKNAAKAYKDGVASVNNSNLKVGAKNPVSSLAAGIGTNKPQSGLQTDSKISNGINAISEGGSKQTHIEVSFEKLLENLVIKTETLTEGVDEMQEKVKKSLVEMVNGVNQIQPR